MRDAAQGGGWCRLPDRMVVARAALHFWEEPCISGDRGTGAVFFSGCVLGCVFCQNDSISHGNFGRVVAEQRLVEIFRELAQQGAHNLELVSPTPYTHLLARVLERPAPGGLPVVWNSGGYERVDTLRALEGKVGVYLPDLKYDDPALGLRYSGVGDYPQVARAAILEMYRQTGPVRLEQGLIRRGVVIRHLLLPGRVGQAKRVMDWVARTFPTGAVLFSLMAQYTPMGRRSGCPELGRTLRPSELRCAREYMENLGLAGYVQELSSVGEGYVPRFDLTGLCPRPCRGQSGRGRRAQGKEKIVF